MNKTVIVGILISALAMVGAIFVGIKTGQFDATNAPQTAAESTRALIGGPFVLTDQTGDQVTEADLLGHYSLVAFGYTYCPDICPLTQQTIAAALDELGRRGDQIVPYLITIDPQRDTVEVLAEYARHFHPRLVALTGTPEQIAEAASVFRIFYGRTGPPVEGAQEYLMEHTSIVYVMGPDGNYVTHFTHATPVDEMVQRLREIL